MSHERTGMYFEEFLQFSPDDLIQHPRTHKITIESNAQFSFSIHDNQPLHTDPDYAKQTMFGEIIINGNQTKAIAESLSVPELTHGTIVANLETNNVKTPHPVKIGDEITVVTKVIGTRETSKNIDGVVQLEHHAFNQHGEEVLSETRTVLIYKDKVLI